MKNKTKLLSREQQYMNILITATEVDDARLFCEQLSLMTKEMGVRNTTHVLNTHKDANDIFAANLAEHIIKNTATHCFQSLMDKGIYILFSNVYDQTFKCEKSTAFIKSHFSSLIALGASIIAMLFSLYINNQTKTMYALIRQYRDVITTGNLRQLLFMIMEHELQEDKYVDNSIAMLKASGLTIDDILEIEHSGDKEKEDKNRSPFFFINTLSTRTRGDLSSLLMFYKQGLVTKKTMEKLLARYSPVRMDSEMPRFMPDDINDTFILLDMLFEHNSALATKGVAELFSKFDFKDIVTALESEPLLNTPKRRYIIAKELFIGSFNGNFDTLINHSRLSLIEIHFPSEIARIITNFIHKPCVQDVYLSRDEFSQGITYTQYLTTIEDSSIYRSLFHGYQKKSSVEIKYAMQALHWMMLDAEIEGSKISALINDISEVDSYFTAIRYLEMNGSDEAFYLLHYCIVKFGIENVVKHVVSDKLLKYLCAIYSPLELLQFANSDQQKASLLNKLNSL